jgi:hypothetical protein
MRRFIMEQDVRDAFDAIDKRLDKLEKAVKHPGDGAKTFGAGGKGNPVDGPAPPAGKPYAALVARYGEEGFAKLIKQNTAGYPETNPALVPYWKYQTEGDAYIADNPEKFKK